MQTTFVLIKPDGVKRGHIGDIVTRLERKRLVIERLEYLQKPSIKLARAHYAEHEGEPFFDRITEFLVSGPIVVMRVSGENAVGAVRQMIGATKPEDRLPGTIRFDLASSYMENVIHASDSEEAAKRENDIWFPTKEICRLLGEAQIRLVATCCIFRMCLLE
jgi:nucleoside-diphosphate kinase